VDDGAAVSRIDAAVKVRDNVYTTYLISPWTKRLLPSLSHRVSPNMVTAVSIVLALVAAWLFAIGSTASVIAGAIVYQLSFAADCLDGQLARYDGTATRVGALLDWQFDRVKETAVVVGLAVGADGEWLAAAALLAMLATRSAITVSYKTLQSQAGEAARQTEPGPLTAAEKWRSLALLPYGDRHLVLGMLAVAIGLRNTLIYLAVWNLAAALLQALRRFDQSQDEAYEDGRTDLHGDGYVGSMLSSRLRFGLHALFAAAIVTVPLWMPATTTWQPYHLVLLPGLLLLAPAVPFWAGPLSSYLFEMGTILLLSRADVSPTLIIAAVVAVTLLRHFVNSDVLTGGLEQGWRRDPLGWELRSVGWLLGAFVASEIAVALVVYTATAAIWRLTSSLADRRRHDAAASGSAAPS